MSDSNERREMRGREVMLSCGLRATIIVVLLHNIDRGYLHVALSLPPIRASDEKIRRPNPKQSSVFISIYFFSPIFSSFCFSLLLFQRSLKTVQDNTCFTLAFCQLYLSGFLLLTLAILRCGE